MVTARLISKDFSILMAEIMPTEDSRLRTMRDNLLVAYAEHREVLEAAFLGDYHCLCASFSNKTASSHCDDNNHGFLAPLKFEATDHVLRLFQTGELKDLGVWALENAEINIRIRPGLELIFDSK